MPKRTRTNVLRLAISIGDGSAPPSEFRIFKPGWNDTENGQLLFDDAAAKSVMAAYAAHGVDRMIDLEHLSLNDEAPNYDPDARGWCRLELRNGELWAVGVTWTADGATRLSEKRQRYISPAVGIDTETRRVDSLVNIAITSLPAIHSTPALVAASKRKKAVRLTAQGASVPQAPGVNSQQLDALAQALGLGDDSNVQDVIASLGALMKTLTDAVNGNAAEPEPDADDPADPAADPAAMGGAPPPSGQAPPGGDDPKKKEMAAARTKLLRLSSKASLGAALEEVETWRKSHLSLSSDRAKLVLEQVALEGEERKKLCASLVKLGAETPATSGLGVGKLCQRLLDEPIAALRDRVEQLSIARGAPRPPPSGGGAGGGSDTAELSASELATCEKYKCDPKVYLRLKKQRDAQKGGS